MQEKSTSLKLRENYYLVILILNLFLFLSRGFSQKIIWIFAAAFSLTFAFLLIKHFKDIFNRKFIFELKPFSSFFLIGLIYILSLIFSDYRLLGSFKEALNFIVLSGFIILLIISIKDFREWDLFRNCFNFFYVLLYIIIGVISIIISIKTFSSTNDISFENINISLFSDYNFFALNILIAFLLIIVLIKNAKSKYIISIYNLALILFFYIVLNTNSRRAIIFLFAINLVLFVYTIYKKNLLNYSLYYSFFILVFLLISSIFLLTSGKSRSYFYDKVFHDGDKTKNVTSLTIYRYSTILGLQNKYKDIKSFLWENKATSSIKIADKFLYKKFIKQANIDFKNQQFNLALNNFNLAKQFNSSTKAFYNDLPTELVSTPDSIFELIPFMYDINYNYHNLFYPINDKYLLLIDTLNIKLNDTLFNFLLFTCDLLNHGSGYSEFPGLFGSNYKMEFIIKKPEYSKFDFSLKNADFNPKNLVYSYDSIILKDEYISYIVDIHVINNNSPLIKFNYNFSNINKNDTILISDVNYYQIHSGNIRLNSFFSNKGNYNQIENYYHRVLKRDHWLNKFIPNWKKKLGKEQFVPLNDSVLYKVLKFKELQDSIYKFHKYVYTRVINKNNISNCDFIVTKDNPFPRGSILIPVLVSGKYRIILKYKTTGNRRLNYYVKRYPEVLDYKFRYQIVEQKEELLNNGWRKLLFKYEIIENTSVQAFFVFGIKQAYVNDTIFLKDFSIECLNSSKLDFIPTIFQFEEINRLLKLYEKKKEKDKYAELLKKKEKLYNFTYNEKDTISTNKMIESRLSRWNFAVEYFREYSLIQKFFGKGFEYNEIYSWKYSNKGKRITEFGYPHNPIISTFLYSGIAGGLIYIWFLILVFYNYWKYRKYHMEFFLIYLIIFFFVFFSDNSHFNTPIFGVFSLFPFFTKYLVEKEQLNQVI